MEKEQGVEMGKWNTRKYMMRDFDSMYKHLESILYLLKKDREIVGDMHPKIAEGIEKYAQMMVIAQETIKQLKQQMFK